MNNNRFGGLIHEYDYDNCLTMTEIAGRIISDWKFDELCRKNIERRKRLQTKNSDVLNEVNL